MKKSKYILLSICAVCAALFIAFFVNVLFKIRTDSILKTEWTAGDALNYVAVMTEAISTFITENDYMRLGNPLYHIERTVQETGGLFADGSHIIYVNGSYENDSEAVGKLMHDFRCTDSDDMFYAELAKHVKHFKETEGGMERMCKAMEERVNRERIDNSFEHIKNLMEAMKITAEQAMEVLKIPDDDKAVLVKKF